MIGGRANSFKILLCGFLCLVFNCADKPKNKIIEPQQNLDVAPHPLELIVQGNYHGFIQTADSIIADSTLTTQHEEMTYWIGLAKMLQGFMMGYTTEKFTMKPECWNLLADSLKLNLVSEILLVLQNKAQEVQQADSMRQVLRSENYELKKAKNNLEKVLKELEMVR